MHFKPYRKVRNKAILNLQNTGIKIMKVICCAVVIAAAVVVAAAVVAAAVVAATTPVTISNYQYQHY